LYPDCLAVFQISVFLILLLVSFSTSIEARFLPDFDDVQDPSIKMVIQSMRAHQIQWNMIMIQTMNVDTPGYVEPGGFNKSKDGLIEVVPFFRWRSGPIVETSNPLDFYLDASSRGFFQVLIPSGLGYTRDGRFTLTLNRKLVMVAGGFPVLGERGEIYLPPGNEIAVSNTGLIYVDGAPIDRMKVVLFKEKGLEALDTLNGSIFYLTGEADVDPEGQYGVKQGCIEQNNVLKALIGDGMMAARTYEATSKAGKSITKLMNSVIQLGNP
jgi:flagellar basal body rod protein FlgF